MGDLAEAVIDGKMCSHCSIVFQEAHGYPVLCKTCHKDETEEERAGIPKATNKEI